MAAPRSARVAILAFVIFLVAFGVYVRTLAPSITWKNKGADSGDLVAAAFTGRIPHPPGYPLYTLLAELFIALPIGGVVFRVNLLSAISAAATLVILYLVIYALVDQEQRWRHTTLQGGLCSFSHPTLDFDWYLLFGTQFHRLRIRKVRMRIYSRVWTDRCFIIASQASQNLLSQMGWQ